MSPVARGRSIGAAGPRRGLSDTLRLPCRCLGILRRD
jgi:hypothetical protein